ncbi:TniQ family protein [Streptomyces sp. LN499]|uniref:TniQ family protein n=1 Tax=Streptomyces sp. LN499 TaxID=3112977 RepID=UPI003719F16C
MSDVRNRPRPLARSLAPLPEESLPGFLLRLSYRLERAPRHVGERLGLGQRHSNIPYPHLRALPDELRKHFSITAGLSDQEAKDLTLEGFAETYPALRKLRNDSRIGATAQANWAMMPSSRYCPDCLRGDNSPIQKALGGAWQLHWHLPVVFACTRHDRLLEHACPSCNLALNSPEHRRPGLIKQPNASALHPLRCRNRIATLPPTPGAFASPVPCGFRLDSISSASGTAIPAGDLDLLITLQQYINQHLTPGHNDSEPPDPLAAFFFPDLITATHLIKLSWPAGRSLLPSDAMTAAIDAYASPILSAINAQIRGAEKTGFRGARIAPDDALVSGALLLAASNLLGNRTPETLAELLVPLAFKAHQRSKWYTLNLVKDGGVSTNFAHAVSRQAPAFRVRNRLRRSPRTYQFQVDEVPPYLPRSRFLEHFTELRSHLPDSTCRNERLLRRGASLRLTEMITGLTWPECGVEMGIGANTARYTLNALGRQLKAGGLWPLFAYATEQIANELDSQEDRVDYANRRKKMENWHLPGTDWRVLFDGLDRLGGMHDRADPRIASVIIWSDVTQDAAINCPIITALRGVGDSRALTSRTSALHEADLGSGQRTRMRQRLNRYASHLAKACDQNRLQSVSMAAVVAEETRLHRGALPQLES